MCAGEGLSSVSRCLALGSAARPRLRRVFVVLAHLLLHVALLFLDVWVAEVVV